MEPDLPDVARSEPQPPKELRALAQLRDRVDAAARELERLRAENAALAARVAELGDGAAAAPGGGTALPGALPGSEHAEKLRAQIQGFIDAIDQVLTTSEPAEAGRSQEG